MVVYSHHIMDGKHSDVHEHTDADNLIGMFTLTATLIHRIRLHVKIKYLNCLDK